MKVELQKFRHKTTFDKAPLRFRGTGGLAVSSAPFAAQNTAWSRMVLEDGRGVWLARGSTSPPFCCKPNLHPSTTPPSSKSLLISSFPTSKASAPGHALPVFRQCAGCAAHPSPLDALYSTHGRFIFAPNNFALQKIFFAFPDYHPLLKRLL